MNGEGVHAAELIALALLVLVVAFAVLAQKIKTPYPIVLVIAGLALSFVPGIPKVQLNPEVVFLVVLPPLLYNGAWQMSWRDFRQNFVSIFIEHHARISRNGMIMIQHILKTRKK